MIRSAQLLVALALFLSASNCRQPASVPPIRVLDKPVDAAKPPGLSIKQIENVFANEDSVTYEGYTVAKLHKNVNVDGISTDVSYAVLRRRKEDIAKFDGLYHPAGNATDFGLFSFLGGDKKQLVVEQSIPRNWRHWVAKLEPSFKIIFESRKWGVDGELIPIDVNQDGVFEFEKKLATFYDFDRIPTSDSPLIDIMFKYDDARQEYVPGNQMLPDYALRGIGDEIGTLHSSDQQEYLSGVVHILLRYIYAGRREEGWSFYEMEYKGSDKASIRAEVLERLKGEPVYMFIYNQQRKH
jgi:hypothetical protein